MLKCSRRLDRYSRPRFFIVPVCQCPVPQVNGSTIFEKGICFVELATSWTNSEIRLDRFPTACRCRYSAVRHAARYVWHGAPHSHSVICHQVASENCIRNRFVCHPTPLAHGTPTWSGTAACMLKSGQASMHCSVFRGKGPTQPFGMAMYSLSHCLL